MDLCGNCGTQYSGYCNNCTSGTGGTKPFMNATKNGCEICVSTHFGSASFRIDGCDALTKMFVNEKGKLCYTDENGQTNCVDPCELMSGASIKCLKDVDDECPPECTSIFGYRNGSYGQVRPEHIEEATAEDEIAIRLEDLVLTNDGCLKADKNCKVDSRHATADCEDNLLNSGEDLDFTQAGPFSNNEGEVSWEYTWDSSYKNETDCCMYIDLRLQGDYCYTFTEGEAYDIFMNVSLVTDSEVVGITPITLGGETSYVASIGHEAGASAPAFISKPFERTWRIKLCPGETFDYKIAQVAIDKAGSLTGLASTNGMGVPTAGEFLAAAALPIITVIETFECTCEEGECTEGCVPDPENDCGIYEVRDYQEGNTGEEVEETEGEEGEGEG